MTASLDEVLALFDKWKNEGSGIHLVLSGRPIATGGVASLTFSGLATVLEVSAHALRLVVGKHSAFTVSLLDACEYTYADRREAPELARSCSGVTFECSVVIRPPTGEQIQLFELKSE